MRRLVPALLVFVATVFSAPAVGISAPDWVRVDYGALVERGLPTHSGETVGELLDRLGGRGFPVAGERRDDDLSHRLLDPVLEPYAFVLPDALDSLAPPPDPPMAEIGGLWIPGEAEPAWVELLRARRYVVESDGRGRMRVFLPWPGGEARGASDGPVDHSSEQAAREAWDAAWPVLRHVFAAERRRLALPGSSAPALEVEARAYRHRRARTVFDLGLAAWRTRVDSDPAPAGRAPFDGEALARVLARPARIEGARLEADGSIRWFTSEAPAPARILARPMTLADAAVAYRAVFHGGLAAPYMSLDRGRTPWVAAVNFGGRLRDTSLGLVSLLSDVRFKTISLGLDPFSGEDVRARLRSEADGFSPHLDRFAADPSSTAVLGQQTRFWFYPDGVELTLSPEGDVFALRRARMIAASERVDERAPPPGETRDPPWTRATVASVNARFEALARLYPELADLDEGARLLAVFAWLRAARDARLAIPDLDALLDVELPAEPTPRRFPHLLTHATLPAPGSNAPVEVLDAARVGEALERLQPSGDRPLPTARRFRRAMAALDPRTPDQAALAREMEQALAAGAPADAQATLAYRAERLAMHRLVLAGAPLGARAAIERRRLAGEPVRVFSVGIGGIDLGMDAALARAQRRTLGLGESGSAGTAAPAPASQSGSVPAPAVPTRTAPRDPAAGQKMRDHGLPERSDDARHGAHALRRGVSGPGAAVRWTFAVYGEDGPDVRSRRRIQDPEGGLPVFERVEDGRFLTFRLAREAEGLRAVPAVAAAPFPAAAAAESTEAREGLAILEVVRTGGESALDGSEPAALRLRLRGPGARDVIADVPRAAARRLVLGHALDLEPERPLPALGVPDPVLAGARGLLLPMEPEQTRPPWAGSSLYVAGEEDAVRLAGALSSWWAASGSPRAVAVATDRATSAGRWAAAPPAAAKPTILVPEEAFPGARAAWRARVLQGLMAGRGADAAGSASLVIVVSAEAPGVLGARLTRLARDPALKGKTLAVAALSSRLRPDLPAGLLAPGNLAAVGVFETGPVGIEGAISRLAAFVAALDAAPKGGRVEAVPGPFVWFY